MSLLRESIGGASFGDNLEQLLQQAAAATTEKKLFDGPAFSDNPKLQDVVNAEDQEGFNRWYDAELARNRTKELNYRCFYSILHFLAPEIELENGFEQRVIDRVPSSNSSLNHILDLDLETSDHAVIFKRVLLEFGFAIARESQEIFWKLLSKIPEQQHLKTVLELLATSRYSIYRPDERQMLASLTPELYLNNEVVAWMLKNKISFSMHQLFLFPKPERNTLTRDQMRAMGSAYDSFPNPIAERERMKNYLYSITTNGADMLFGEKHPIELARIFAALEQDDTANLTNAMFLLLTSPAIRTEVLAFDTEKRKFFDSWFSRIASATESEYLTNRIVHSLEPTELCSLFIFGFQFNTYYLRHLLIDITYKLLRNQKNAEKLSATANEFYTWLKTQNKPQGDELEWVTLLLKRKRSEVLLEKATV